MKKDRILLIIGAFLLFVLLFSTGKLLSIYSGYRKSAESYDALREIASASAVPTPAPQTGGASSSSVLLPTATPDPTVWPPIDFAALREINEDIVGWIIIEDTVIDYPIVQAKDNDYYLDHIFDGKKNPTGCIFLDCKNSPAFSDPHSVIYGHHMKDGSMFAGLKYYKSQEYFDAHPSGYLLTPEKNYHIDFFSGYVAHASESAWDLELEDTALQDLCAEAAERSCFASSFVPEPGERIITLSTCSYEFDDARFILLGVLR